MEGVEKELGYIAVVVIDSWHLANNVHFGDILYDYDSTGKMFSNSMDAIQNAFDQLSNKYKGIKPVSKKGLLDTHNNELEYNGGEVHIICFPIHN